MEEQWPSENTLLFLGFHLPVALFSLLFVPFAIIVLCFYLLSWQEEGVKTFNLNFNFFYNLYDKLELLGTLTLKDVVRQ